VRPAAQPALTHPAPPPGPAAQRSPALGYQRIALVDLLDRLLAGGVVISGEVRLSIADVDMVHISLRALISSVSSLVHCPAGEERRGAS
jgi:hypothetical protein